MRQQGEDPFVFIRSSRETPRGGGIGSRLFRHYKHKESVRPLVSKRELLIQGSLEDV